MSPSSSEGREVATIGALLGEGVVTTGAIVLLTGMGDVVGPTGGRISMSEHELNQNSVKFQYQSTVYFPGAILAGIVTFASVLRKPSEFLYQ